MEHKKKTFEEYTIFHLYEAVGSVIYADEEHRIVVTFNGSGTFNIYRVLRNNQFICVYVWQTADDSISTKSLDDLIAYIRNYLSNFDWSNLEDMQP